MRIDTVQTALCPFCGTSELQLLIPAEALGPDQVNVVKCRLCGLVFLQASDMPNQMCRQETAYWNNEDQNKIYLDERIREMFQKEYERRLSALKRYVGGVGKLLDVGCGVGHFMAAAARGGWTASGLDISSAAQSAANQTYGFRVEVGTLEAKEVGSDETGIFDAVTLWDVIEHIRKSIENLKTANRLLRMGGILALKTPNEESLFKQTALSAYRLLGSRAAFLLKYVYYIPHYFSYSKKSLSHLLERCGFEVVHYELEETPQDFAEEKINVHYQDDPKRALVVAVLPIASFLGRVFHRSNKMVVYARKISETTSHS